MKNLFLAANILIMFAACGQSKTKISYQPVNDSLPGGDYNFGFEKFKPGTDTLLAWNRKTGPSYYGPVFTVDTVVKHSGRQSLRIERRHIDTSTSFTPINVSIPANFQGEWITVSVWLKTENVSQYAQLWLRIDDADKGVLSLTNYPRNSLKGTTDWTEYTTTIPMSEDARMIYLGFLITGTGKVWADDFKFLVDEVPLEKVPGIKFKNYPATADHKQFVSGSGISITSLTGQQVENLSILGRIWGFLKYFHPVIARGDLNWDYELFRFLPGYLSVKDEEERNQALLEWINKLEKPAICDSCEQYLKTAVHKPDLEWINDKKTLGSELSEHLIYIKNNRHQGKNYYIDLVKYTKNPKITHENAYSQFNYPDAGYRLLALFRYWNLIQYWFPYKHLIGEDWNNVLTEFIPKLVNTTDATSYTLTMQQLIARIHDTHANIWGSNKILDSLKGKFNPPVKIKFIKEQAVVSLITNPELAKNSDLKPGDIVLAVDGRKVSDLIREKKINLPASNYSTQLRDLASYLLISNDSSSLLTIIREGHQFETRIKREAARNTAGKSFYDFSYQRDSSFFFISPGIGYINLGKINDRQLDSVFSVLKNSRGLIIDNRQYPGSFPLYSLAEKLLPEKAEFTAILEGSLEYPGMFSERTRLSVGKNNPDYYKGKTVILVNQNTQSSAEFHSMAFRRAPGAVVIGSTTAGADGNVSGFYLPGGIYTIFSGIAILNPDNSETQRVGIIPDILAEPTIEGIKSHRDELIEKAVEVINGSVKSKKGF